MSLILDIILAALLIIAYIAGRKKGLLKSIWKIAALAVTIILVLLLKDPAVDFVSGTRAASDIYSSISDKITIPSGGGVNITESLHLPEFMQSQINEGLTGAQNTASQVTDTAAISLTQIVILIGVCIALFIIIRLILMAVFHILNGLTKAPGIKSVNRFAGGVLSVINMIFIIFLALALFTLFAPADSFLYEAINKSHIVKYFYNYNILLQLFMKI